MPSLTLTRDSIVSRATDLFEAPVGTDVMLMSVAEGRYFALDPVAAAVWHGLETPTPVSALCASLVARYAVDAATCEADVLRFLEALRDAQLLVVADGA